MMRVTVFLAVCASAAVRLNQAAAGPDCACIGKTEGPDCACIGKEEKHSLVAKKGPDCDCVGGKTEGPDCDCVGGNKETPVIAAKKGPDCDCVGGKTEGPDCDCIGKTGKDEKHALLSKKGPDCACIGKTEGPDCACIGKEEEKHSLVAAKKGPDCACIGKTEGPDCACIGKEAKKGPDCDCVNKVDCPYCDGTGKEEKHSLVAAKKGPDCACIGKTEGPDCACIGKEEKATSFVQLAAREDPAPEDQLAKEMTHDLEMNFNKIAPFGKEDTAKELQDHAADTQDTLVDAVENAEVAEIKRAVFRALTRLRAATIKEFDTIARLETQAIDAYNDAHHYRAENPLSHLHEDEAPVETDKLKSFH